MRVEPFGPKEAKYAIIGEAPGATEAREGRPFIGPSGELLHKALEEVGLDPSEVYITNVYKEYRPGNPTPTPEEINECIPELADELASLPNLKHVLVVGNTPMRALTGRSGGILKSQGSLLAPRKAMEHLNVNIMAVMHPAYVLRNNNYQTQNLFREIVGSFVALGREQQIEEVVVLDNLKDTEAFYRDAETFNLASIDIEATPVPWWDPDFWVISAAISFDGKRAYVIDTRDSIKVLRKLTAEYPDMKWIMHNGSYDRQALLSLGIDLRLFFDTMTAQYIIDPDSRKGLQYLSSVYLGLPPYKDVDYKNIREEPFDKIAQMNGVDAIRTYRLYEKLFPKIKGDDRLARLYKFVMEPAINALLEMELEGMPIDLDRLAATTEIYEARLVKATDSIRGVAKAHGMERFNPRSTKQMNELVFGKLGLPVVKRTKTGNPSLDKEVRLNLKSDPFIAMLDEYKTVQQRLGTFLYPWQEMAQGGRIHTKYKPNHVVSGRLSSEKPNMQQVPNDPDIRSVFGGVPGHKLVMLDYSQLELRLAANFAKEPAMMEAYEKGEDLHTLTALKILKDGKARQAGKILNFSLLYGAGPMMLKHIAWVQYGLDLTLEQAKDLHQGFFRAYPSLLTWHRDTLSAAKRDGYVQSPLGRRRYLPNINSWEDTARRHDEKVALNHRVQSLGSDLMLLSLVEMHKQGLQVRATVHDSVILEAPDEGARMVGEHAKHIMETMSDVVRKKFGFDIEVPLVADLHIDTHWTKG